jgi:predicted nucleic acid-binding Zn finger protein
MSLSFGRRLKEAKKLVQNDAVKKYVINEKSERWIVVGNSCDYLNLKTPIWCRCYAFQQGLYDDPFFQCKHSLAVKLAIKENKFKEFRLSKEEFDLLRKDWLF